MAITPDDKKISQMAEVAPSAGMFVPMVDLTQLPASQNVRASVGSILALVDLSGYVQSSRTIATSGSLTGGGNLSADLSLSLDGDSAAPGNSQYYGTDGSGTKGFFALPAAGTGTVTSFSSGNLSPLFTTNVATATTTPALAFTLSTQSANLVFAGPTNGAAAAPAFRSLVAADIPNLSAVYDVAGSAATAESNANTYTDTEISGLSSVYQPLNANLTAISALTTTSYGLDFLELVDAAAARAYIGAGTGSGSVTSVGLTMPTGFSVGGSPVTTTGTLAVTTTLSGIVVGDGSGLIARTATGTADRISITNGSGVSGNPTFDIAATYAGQTSITTLGTIATGTWSATTIAASRGGTGQTTYAAGDLLYGNGGGTLSKLAEPGLPGYVLSAVGGTPAWVQLSTLTATEITGTANQVLVNGTTGSAQTGPVTLTLPQDIGTGSSVQFGALDGTPIGATTPSTGAFTTVNASGTSVFSGLLSATSPGVAFSISGGGTSAQYQRFNTSGGNYYVGVSDSSGAGLLSGVGAYGFAILSESNRNVAIGVNNVLVALFTSTGLNSTAIGFTTPSTAAFTVATALDGASQYPLITGPSSLLVLRVNSVTILTAGAPADIATITVPAWCTRWVMTGSSAAVVIGSVAVAETAAGSLSAAAVEFRDAAGGGGSAITTVAAAMPTAAGNAASFRAVTTTIFSSSTIYIRQTTDSANAGTVSFYVTILPLL